jgi:hypothetical protein
MAFRIHDSVARGEIDNRTKGIVRGRIWLEGKKEPLVLELTGNAWRDLAGCFLSFENPGERVVDKNSDSIAPLQRGRIGDLTASRKVRVWDVPFEEGYAMCKRGEKPPEHMANCLYLEWFSEVNGRVVIESADYQLKISAPEWTLTEDEERERAEMAAEGMVEFMGRLTAAVEEQKRGQKDPEESWDEFDYERLLKECDARGEKYAELLDKYGDSEEGRKRVEEEMGWNEPLTEEQLARAAEIEEIDANELIDGAEPEMDPAREGIDWVRDEEGDVCHPLQLRGSRLGVKLLQAAQAVEKGEESSAADFAVGVASIGAKLAGALGPVARGDIAPDPAFTVALLKRALSILHASQAELEQVAGEKIFSAELIAETRQELLEIRQGILDLMAELRGKI